MIIDECSYYVQFLRNFHQLKRKLISIIKRRRLDVLAVVLNRSDFERYEDKALIFLPVIELSELYHHTHTEVLACLKN